MNTKISKRITITYSSEHEKITKDHNVLKVRYGELHSQFSLLEKQVLLLHHFLHVYFIANFIPSMPCLLIFLVLLNSVERRLRLNKALSSLLEAHGRPNQVPKLNQMVLDMSALLSPLPTEPLENISWPPPDNVDMEYPLPFLNDLIPKPIMRVLVLFPNFPFLLSTCRSITAIAFSFNFMVGKNGTSQC